MHATEVAHIGAIPRDEETLVRRKLCRRYGGISPCVQTEIFGIVSDGDDSLSEIKRKVGGIMTQGIANKWGDAERKWLALHGEKGAKHADTVAARAEASALEAEMNLAVVKVALDLYKKAKGER